MEKKQKISFSCPDDLRKQIDEIAKREGVARSRLIVELLKLGLSVYDPQSMPYRDVGTEKIILMSQQRLEEIEKWRDELENWKKRIMEEIGNHEEVIMALLNEEVIKPPEDKSTKKRKKVPRPRSKN